VPQRMGKMAFAIEFLFCIAFFQELKAKMF